MPRVDHLSLRTSDHVRLAAEHHPPGPDAVDGLAVVLGHGFTLHRQRQSVRRLALSLTAVGGVVAVDFRGHGASAGASTLGAREALDVDAAIRWARRRGYRCVVSMGFSMGGAAVLLQAATLAGLSHDAHVDAVVSVSATSRWFITESARLRLVAVAVGTRPTRLATRLVRGTRVTGDFTDIGPQPLDVVARIAPTPLLLVHGGRDRWFGPEHAEALGRAAGPTAEVWIEPAFGHAEEAMTEELTSRIISWIVRIATQTPCSDPA